MQINLGGSNSNEYLSQEPAVEIENLYLDPIDEVRFLLVQRYILFYFSCITLAEGSNFSQKAHKVLHNDICSFMDRRSKQMFMVLVKMLNIF